MYRTDSFPTNGTIGFWVEGYKTDGTTLYAAGAGSTRGSTTMVQLPQSSTKWVFYTYDLSWINIEDREYSTVMGYITHIGMFLPTSGSLDIAYIDYHSTMEEAHTFGEDAAHYMNNYSTVDPAPSPSAYAFDFVLDQYESTALSTWATAQDNYTTALNVRDIESTNHGYLNISDAEYNDGEYDAVYFLSGVKLAKANTRYLTLVYRTHNLSGVNTIGFWVDGYKSDGSSAYSAGKSTTRGEWTTMTTLDLSETEWTYQTFDLQTLISAKDGEYNSVMSYISAIGVYLPGFTNSSQSLDIAYIDYYSSQSAANTFGAAAAAHMNSGSISANTVTTPAKEWNTGNNTAFSMLYANSGGGWFSATDTIAGGPNSRENGFYSYQIGQTYYTTTTESTSNDYRTTAKSNGYPVSDSIFLLNMYNFDELNTETLPLGYKLFNLAGQGLEGGGVYTIGLLESGLIDVTGVDGKSYTIPQYKEDTVAYIAYLLRDSLKIGQRDSSGNYNYNFVHGARNGAQYGYADAAKTQPYDLAEALRAQLDLKLPDSGDGNFTVDTEKRTAADYLGTYADTLTKKDMLIGPFLDCMAALEAAGKKLTCYDAAYYMLHNLFVDDSYNQLQDDYNYLVLSKAKISATQKDAYVFDGGFTTGVNADKISSDAEADEYAATSDTAVVYNPLVSKDADGNIVTGNGTISLSTATSKDVIWYDNDGSRTTRFPFLPVTDPDENTPYADPLVVNFLDDGARSNTTVGATYADRNYNFVMQANGEFVYHYEDELFFEFQGDDDVYLFVNGQLIMDIGGAHSITSVSMEMNTYVDWAQGIKDDTTAYNALSTAEKARVDALALKDGDSYSIDFYYMERHGWGSNMRVATNIVMTDPALQTQKTAYQNGGEIPYGGLVTDTQKVEYGFSMTNAGNNKLYKLSFEDASIGVSLNHTAGLTVYGKATETTITTTGASSTVTISTLHGAANLDGTAYLSDPNGTITIPDVKAGDHTLTLYQIQSDNNTALYQDATVTVKEGSTTLKSGLTVQGIRVTDANGERLDPEDLVITVDGYYDEGKTQPTGTLSIPIAAVTDTSGTVTKTALQALKDFMFDLQSGSTQSGEDDSSLFAGAGLWRHGTVSVRGIWYLMTDEEQEKDLFDNTVYTVAHPSTTSDTIVKGEATHRIRSVGDAIAFYQWAGHNLYIEEQTVLDEAGVTNYTANQLTMYLSDSDGNTRSYDSVTNSGSLLTVNYEKPGTQTITYVSFSRVNSSGSTEIVKTVPIIYHVADVEDNTLVLDHGLKADLCADGGIYANDTVSITNSAVKVMGLTTGSVSYLDGGDSGYTASAYDLYNLNRISFTNAANTDGALAKQTGHDGQYSITDGRLYFTPTDFMDGVYTVHAAVTVHESGYTPKAVGPANSSTATYKIDISKEVQMYQQVTVLPANVVYYEDDFAGVSYSDNGTFTKHGSGSGSLTQGVDQTIPYGQDPAYQDTYDMSGSSLKEYAISDDSVFASFTFTGTGFEILSRTDAVNCGTMIVEIFETDENGKKVQKDYNGDDTIDDSDHFKLLPVITEFDNVSTGSGGSEVIYQVPVIRVDGLDKASYIVEISGSPEYDVTAPEANWVKNDDGELLPPLSKNQNTLYIDGIRVFQPMGADPKNSEGVSYYNAKEAGASFSEVRQLLLDSQMAFVNWTSIQSGFQACTGNIIWSENRNGFEQNGTTYTSTLVDSIEDYLVFGPNNELYFRRTTKSTGTQNSDGTDVTNRQMLLFYVEEDDDAATTGSLQIATRGIDLNLFQGKTGNSVDMEFKYIKENGNTDAEETITVAEGSTEQYYNINYASCPYTTKDGKKVYTVMLLARTANTSTGMLSFTSLKHNGLTIKPISEVNTGLEDDQIMSGTSWSFDENGMLVTPEGQTYGSAHFDLRKISQTIQDVETARQQALQKPGPDVNTATPAPVDKGMNKVLKISLLTAGTIAVLAGAWYLSKKFLHLL